MPPHRPGWPWEQLSVELLELIAGHLPCLVDRINASRAYFSWFDAFEQQPPLLNQLPYLILPLRVEQLGPPPVGRRRPTLFCALHDRSTHQIRGLPSARYFGAYEGGWIFIANYAIRNHELINLYSYRRVPIPDTDFLPFHRMTILAATLSCTPPPVIGPVAPDHLRCVGAAIFCTSSTTDPDAISSGPRTMLWFVGDPHERPFYSPDPPSEYYEVVVDLIYFHGFFNLLTQAENMIGVTLDSGDGQQHHIVEMPLLRFEREHDDDDGGDEQVDARYLVESRGELLMVVRFTPRHPSLVPSFRVFQRAPSEGHADYSWAELPDGLDGRMLFVARGCSRSFDVPDFPGSEEGIYFLDDTNHDHVNMINSRAQHREYYCRANGRWTGPNVHLWFPEEPISWLSPSAWFLS